MGMGGAGKERFAQRERERERVVIDGAFRGETHCAEGLCGLLPEVCDGASTQRSRGDLGLD